MIIKKGTHKLAFLLLAITAPAFALAEMGPPDKPQVLVTNNRRVDFDWEKGEAASAVKWSIQLEGVVFCIIKGNIVIDVATFTLDADSKDTKHRLSWQDMMTALKKAAAKTFKVDPYDVKQPEFRGTARVKGLDAENKAGPASQASDPFNIPN